MAPQLVLDRLYFLSNLSGRLSLYTMRYGGGIPEPLLPSDIAMQNPQLLGGYSYYVFPLIDKILVMLDKDGDENYQPMVIPMDGGFPEPAFGNQLDPYRVHCYHCYPDEQLIYLSAESRSEQITKTFQGDLATGTLIELAGSPWGSYPGGIKHDHSKVILIDGYTVGDNVIYLWIRGGGERQLLYGVPIEQRTPGQEVPLNSITACQFTPDNGLLFETSLFSDTFGLGYLKLTDPQNIKPVSITGFTHSGFGEYVGLEHLRGNRYAFTYNIDGCSWLYEGEFFEESLSVKLDHIICGHGLLSNGVIEGYTYDKTSDRYALTFSTATLPTQIYTVEGKDRTAIIRHTNEHILGVPYEYLSPGEDASFTSFDNTRISARLYLPAPVLGFIPPRPLIYYIHGGPQGQERPDFAWFSMPLIQFLTLQGFAVFVPNVRGSSGYGLNYMKQVDHDWGGKDRIDHVFAMQSVLPQDKRLDITHAGVVGRSYGGYMTLIQAFRYPELWKAAVDMFGPYDLITFIERLPETWKPYFKIAIGDPEKETDRIFLNERSPKTYINNLSCPLFVIQGKNDPRVIEAESRDVVENLRATGKIVEYLMFENEGHDVLKHENRVNCYNSIANFFKKYLFTD